MTRPKASELDSNSLLFVTKLSVRSPIVAAVAPGILKNTGTLQRMSPNAPQTYLIIKSCFCQQAQKDNIFDLTSIMPCVKRRRNISILC